MDDWDTAGDTIAISPDFLTEVRPLPRFDALISQTAEGTGAAAAATALANSGEVRGLSSLGAALSRAIEGSGAAAAATAVANSREVRELSSLGAALSRAIEGSGAAAAATAVANSREVRELSSLGAALSRAIEGSGATAAATALADSEEVKRVSRFGTAIARSAEGSSHRAICDSLVRMGEAHRNSIVSIAKASAVLGSVSQFRPQPGSWLLDGVDPGFARLSNLGRAIHSEEPFSRTLGKLLENELGGISTPDLSANACERDEAAVRGGLNPELIAFPCADYPDVLSSAGFRLSLPRVPVPKAIRDHDAGAVFDAHHWQICRDLEQRLRQLVEQRLSDLFGSNWAKTRVPGDVRKRWLERQEADCAEGRTVYSEIQYADFMDLAAVIRKRDNWREAFDGVFESKEDIAVSLHRLHPVRKALAHSRPLGRADVLTLIGEATRIFRALGMRVLH